MMRLWTITLVETFFLSACHSPAPIYETHRNCHNDIRHLSCYRWAKWFQF